MDNYEGVVVLSLGSNIGDREENLRNALVELELVGEINLISSLYESDPLLVTEQRSFYNIVIEITYTKSATHLLKDVKRIEEKIGRTKTYRYGPRVIDIDIIFFKAEVHSSENLIIPHYDWSNRLFVIEPLREIITTFDTSNLNINDQKLEKIGNIIYK